MSLPRNSAFHECAVMMTEVEGRVVQDSEAGIHGLVPGSGHKAGKSRVRGRAGGPLTGAGADAAQLGQGRREWAIESSRGQDRHTGNI